MRSRVLSTTPEIALPPKLMPDQDDVVEVFVFDHVRDVGNKQVKINRLGNQARALAEARLRRRFNLVAAANVPLPRAPPKLVLRSHVALIAASKRIDCNLVAPC
jgi:hypothetical protein